MGSLNLGSFFRITEVSWNKLLIPLLLQEIPKSRKEIKGKKSQTDHHFLKLTASKKNIFTSNIKSNEKVLTRLSEISVGKIH